MTSLNNNKKRKTFMKIASFIKKAKRYIKKRKV